MNRRFDRQLPSRQKPEPRARTRSPARLPLGSIGLLVPTFLSMVASAGNTHEAAHTGVRVGVLALGCAVASALPEVSSGSVTSRQGASDHPLTFIFRPSFQSNPGKGPAQPQAAKSSSRKRDGDIHTSRREASAASLHAGATSVGKHTDERHSRRAPDPEEVPTFFFITLEPRVE